MRWAFLLGGLLLVTAPAHTASVLSVGDGDGEACEALR